MLDLGVFAALQAMQWKQQTKTVNAMVERVEQVFADWPKEKLNNVFLTLQTCMNEIVDANGDNDYKIVHMRKEVLEREGMLPRSIRTTKNANASTVEEDEEDNDLSLAKE